MLKIRKYIPLKKERLAIAGEQKTQNSVFGIRLLLLAVFLAVDAVPKECFDLIPWKKRKTVQRFFFRWKPPISSMPCVTCLQKWGDPVKGTFLEKDGCSCAYRVLQHKDYPFLSSYNAAGIRG